MHRRSLLTILGTLSAGCVGAPSRTGSSTESTRVTTANPTLEQSHPSVAELVSSCSSPGGGTVTTGAESAFPHIGIGVNPPDNDVFLNVRITRQYTSRHPARMEVIVGNTAATQRRFTYGPNPISHGTDIDTGTHLMADWRTNPENHSFESGGCWRANESSLIAEPILRYVDIQPGETTNESYDLVLPKDSEVCVPHGVYRFSGTVKVGADGERTDLVWALCFD